MEAGAEAEVVQGNQASSGREVRGDHVGRGAVRG